MLFCNVETGTRTEEEVARPCVVAVEFFESFSLELKTDHRKYRFGFSACLRTAFESPPPSEKPYRSDRFFSGTARNRNR